MTDEIEWSLNMSDTDFAKVSERYFDDRYIDLHTGCCLIKKEDPQLRLDEQRIVGQDYLKKSARDATYDETMRPFRAALSSMKQTPNYTPLIPEKWKKKIKNGLDVRFNTRDFIVWAIEENKNTSSHLKLAESRYRERRDAREVSRGKPLKPSDAHWQMRKNEFISLMNLGKVKWGPDPDYTELAGTLQEHLKILEAHLKKNGFEQVPKPISNQSLRKAISDWHEEAIKLGNTTPK